MELNGRAPGRLAAATDALFVQVSTNEVFAGSAAEPYTEDDEPDPINPYGASKLAGERAVAAAASRYLIVRTAWLFGPGGRNFVTRILEVARAAEARGEPARIVDDEWGNPTWTPALADAIVDRRGDCRRGGPASSTSPDRRPRPGSAGPSRVLAAQSGFAAPAPISSAAFPRASAVPPRAVLWPSARGRARPPRARMDGSAGRVRRLAGHRGMIRVSPTSLDGVLVLEPEVHADDRGFFVETYRREELAGPGSRSTSSRRTTPARSGARFAACTSRSCPGRRSWCAWRAAGSSTSRSTSAAAPPPSAGTRPSSSTTWRIGRSSCPRASPTASAC